MQMAMAMCGACRKQVPAAETSYDPNGVPQCKRCESHSVAAQLDGIIRRPRVGAPGALFGIAFLSVALHLYWSPRYFGFTIGPSLFAPPIFDAFTLGSAFALLFACIEVRRAKSAVGPMLLTVGAIVLGLYGVVTKLLPLV